METTKPISVTEQTRIVERMMSGENRSMISLELVTMMDCITEKNSIELSDTQSFRYICL